MPRHTLDRLRGIFPLGAAVPDVRPHRGVPLDLSRPGRGGPPPGLDRQGDPERRDPGGPRRTARAAGPGEEGELVHRGAAGGPGLLERPGADRASGSARCRARQPAWRQPELAVWSGDTVVADEDGLPVLRRPRRRDDQDLRLPGQPDRDRGGRLRHRSGGRRRRARASRTRRSASGSCWSATADGDGPARRRARCSPSCASTLPRFMVPGEVREMDVAAPVAQRQVRPRAAAQGGRRDDGPGTRRSAFGTAGRRAARRRHPARAADGAGRAPRRTSPTTAAAITRRVAAAARGAAGRHRHRLRGQGQPHARGGPAPRGLVDSLDVASAGEMARRAGHRRCRPTGSASPGPGKTAGELRQAVAAGVIVELESEGEARRVAAVGRAARAAAAGRGPGQPGLRGQGLGHADGRRAAAVRRRRRAGAGPARARRATSTSTCSDSTSSPARRTCAPRSSSRRSAQTVELLLRLADKVARAAVATSTSAAASASRTSTADAPLDLDRDRREPARAARRRDPPALPEARVVVELGRYLVGESGVYVTRVVDRKVSRGRDLPGRRRRHAPPARGVRATSARSSAATTRSPSATGPTQPGDGDRHRGRLPVHTRSTCSATTSTCPRHRGRRPRRRCSRPAPTATPRARPRFLGHPAPAEVLV